MLTSAEKNISCFIVKLQIKHIFTIDIQQVYLVKARAFLDRQLALG